MYMSDHIDFTQRTPTSLLKVRHSVLHVTLLMCWYITSASKRLGCAKIIEPGKVEHQGPHIHTNEEQPVHSCESR